MKFRISFFIIAFAIIFSGFGAIPAAAAEYEFAARYVNITVRDDVLVMTPNTTKYDPVWTDAGVTDVSAKLKEFTNMGVTAAFYDPATQTTVNFISRQSSDTVSLFSFSGMSESDIIDYVKSLLAEDSDISTDVSAFETGGIKFFRLEINGSGNTAYGREIIYGTAENAQMLQFDIYSSTGAGLDEGFLKEVVSGMKFTRIMTKEEYEAEAAAAARKFFIGAGIFFGLMIVLAIYVIIRKKRIKKRLQRISDGIAQFKNKRNNGEIDDSAEPLFIASSIYDETTVNNFFLFNTWFKSMPVLIPAGLLYVVIIYMMIRYGHLMVAVITIAAGVVLLYMHYTRMEKLKEVTKKQLNTAGKPVVTARFYEEYYTVNGLGAATEYPLLQVTSVDRWHEYIFIYTGADNALYLKADGVEGGKADELTAFLKSHIN